MFIERKYMAIYNNFNDVKKEIKNKYQNAKSLSRSNGTGCVYNHNINGIGCAIGCLIDNELALYLDNYGCYLNGNKKDSPSISNLHTVYTDKEDAQLKKLFEEIFDLSEIEISDLNQIQTYHDTANGVDDFLNKLNNYKPISKGILINE